MKQSYETDIILGDKYRDAQTGLEGTVTVVSFYQHGCERVNLETVKDGSVTDYGFDAPRLTHIESDKTATTSRTGGPAKGATARPEVPKRR